MIRITIEVQTDFRQLLREIQEIARNHQLLLMNASYYYLALNPVYPLPLWTARSLAAAQKIRVAVLCLSSGCSSLPAGDDGAGQQLPLTLTDVRVHVASAHPHPGG